MAAALSLSAALGTNTGTINGIEVAPTSSPYMGESAQCTASGSIETMTAVVPKFDTGDDKTGFVNTDLDFVQWLKETFGVNTGDRSIDYYPVVNNFTNLASVQFAAANDPGVADTSRQFPDMCKWYKNYQSNATIVTGLPRPDTAMISRANSIEVGDVMMMPVLINSASGMDGMTVKRNAGECPWNTASGGDCAKYDEGFTAPEGRMRKNFHIFFSPNCYQSACENPAQTPTAATGAGQGRISMPWGFNYNWKVSTTTGINERLVVMKDRWGLGNQQWMQANGKSTPYEYDEEGGFINIIGYNATGDNVGPEFWPKQPNTVSDEAWPQFDQAMMLRDDLVVNEFDLKSDPICLGVVLGQLKLKPDRYFWNSKLTSGVDSDGEQILVSSVNSTCAAPQSANLDGSGSLVMADEPPSLPPPSAPPPGAPCPQHDCRSFFGVDEGGSCPAGQEPLADNILSTKSCGVGDNCNGARKTVPCTAQQCCHKLTTTTRKDPHVAFAHGGRADLRGEPGSVFNFLSARNVSFNLKTDGSDFKWSNRLIHGTKLSEGFWTIRTETGRTVYAAYDSAWPRRVSVKTSDEASITRVTQDTPLLVDNVRIEVVDRVAKVTVLGKWQMVAKTSAFPFASLNPGKVLLDISITALYDVDHDAVAPHGINGQSWDRDDLAVDGKIDSRSGKESTTSAQAEGAIEGTYLDYKIDPANPYSTAFKFSRFDSLSAKPRDVSKLSGAKRKSSKSLLGATAVTAADVLPVEAE